MIRLKRPHHDFKKEVRTEIDQLRQLVMSHHNQSIPVTTPLVNMLPDNTTAASSSSSRPDSTVILDNTTSTGVSPSSASSSDVQAQMMLMLTEAFSKFSSVLAYKHQDTKAEVKSDWPKFGGDSKKFKSWYLSIVAQLSIPPWQEFYDQSTNSVIKSTTNSMLNGKLYAKLLVSLEGQALQDMVARSYLRANGLLLLLEMMHTYKPCKVPEVLAAKAGEFWSKTKRGQNESVDSYYNRFQDLLEDLNEADDKISTASAMRQFIFTLVPEFLPIQNLYRIDNLPIVWKTTSWPELLVLCRDFYHSINPKGVTPRETTNTNDYNTRMNQQKKVKEWFLQPLKFCKEIEREQKKYPDMCIFHLSKSHATDACYLKKECEKIKSQPKEANGKSSSQTGSTVGQLRHITEDLYEDAVDDSEISQEVHDESNDTNETDLLYFSRMANHDLRIVKSSENANVRHSMKYPVIADSEANFHMFREREFFVNLIPATGCV